MDIEDQQNCFKIICTPPCTLRQPWVSVRSLFFYFPYISVNTFHCGYSNSDACESLVVYTWGAIVDPEPGKLHLEPPSPGPMDIRHNYGRQEVAHCWQLFWWRQWLGGDPGTIHWEKWEMDGWKEGRRASGRLVGTTCSTV